jgi:hypothetical protein
MESNGLGDGKENKLKGGENMRISIQISKTDLEILQKLENITGIGKNSIVSLLIGEVYSSYKCAKMSRNADYMPVALATEKFKKNIRR